jgi:hypothetical protein
VHNAALHNGARNLLLNCARAAPGERVLLVGEQGAAPYFDARLCDDLAEACARLGIDADILLAEPGADAEHFPPAVSQAMQTADITIFFSRLGDQLRFLDSPGPGRKIMCYTLTREHMASPFAGIDYRLMQCVHDCLLARLKGAETVAFTAENGTSMLAEMSHRADGEQALLTDFSLGLFPVMIIPPVNFHLLNGHLVLEHFITSSSTRAYADSVLMLETPVVARIEDSRMVEFTGDAALIKRLRSQLERAAGITGGDPYRLNSWHAGINPYTFFDGDPYADLERWGTVAYGSPRFTHIHAAGKNPGDISIQLFDASIRFDDQLIWNRGRFDFLDSDEIHALLNPDERKLLNASIRLEIGV